jgi:hypothetical protein
MATFSAIAWIDLVPGADVEAVLATLRDGEPRDGPANLYARVVDPGTPGVRIEAAAGGVGYEMLADLVVNLMRGSGTVMRALLVLDHDEYGAEHIVLDQAQGVVRRVQHVFVYPRSWWGRMYREGEPALTHVPPAVRSRGNPRRGRLVDGPAAWAAAAELYGVPVRRMTQAAAKASKAHHSLCTVGAPVAPWLDALGIAWMDERGGPSRKLRPGPVWSQAVTRYVLPRLPGRWLVLDDEIVRQPVGLVACVLLQSRHTLYAIVHPLYLPIRDGNLGWNVNNSIEIRGVWPQFATVEEGEPSMRRLADVIRDEAMPYFARYGSAPGFRRLCQERNQGHPNGIGDPNRLWNQALTEVVLERDDDAAATLDALRQIIQTDRHPTPWRLDLLARADTVRRQLAHDPAAARSALLANVTDQRRLHGLPPSEHGSTPT